MFIRQTKTSNAASGEAYTTFRLVASERIGGKVRQRMQIPDDPGHGFHVIPAGDSI